MRAKNIVRRSRGRVRRPSASHPTAGPPPSRGQSTREQLLETAGQVFAEKGFDGATGKEICERSGANAAAVVYHFGGLENLYRACLLEARARLAPSEALAEVVARESDARAKLAAFISLMVRVLAGPASSAWPARLISREMISPSRIFDEIRAREMRARAAILQSIIAELTGLPVDHPTVARACINVMAPLGILMLMGAARVERAFPMLSLGPDSMEETTRHMLKFALGGIAEVAAAPGRSAHQNTK